MYIGRNFAWYAKINTTPGERHVMKNNTDEERRRVVEQYKQHLVDKDKLKYFHKLRSATLACWCVPKLCHGTVLKKLQKGCREEKPS